MNNDKNKEEITNIADLILQRLEEASHRKLAVKCCCDC